MIFNMTAYEGDPLGSLKKILDKSKVAACDFNFLSGCVYGEIPNPALIAGQFVKTCGDSSVLRAEGGATHFVADIYPDPSDGATVENLMVCAEEIAETTLRGHEAVIVVHDDTVTPHAHIALCAVNLLTGKPLDTSEREDERRRVRVQRVGLKYGFSLAPYGGGG